MHSSVPLAHCYPLLLPPSAPTSLNPARHHARFPPLAPCASFTSRPHCTRPLSTNCSCAQVLGPSISLCARARWLSIALSPSSPHISHISFSQPSTHDRF